MQVVKNKHQLSVCDLAIEPVLLNNSRFKGAVLTTLVAACLQPAISFADPKVLVIGDYANFSGHDGRPYTDALNAEMNSAFGAANVSRIDYRRVAEPSLPATPDLTPANLKLPNGDSYDLIVVNAIYGGMSAASRDVLIEGVKTRAAGTFFLFPDQCSACTPNIDQITLPVLNDILPSATVTRHTAPPPTSPRSLVLNVNSPYQGSFSSLSTMQARDFSTVDGVPASNALYMEQAASIPTAAEVASNSAVSNVAGIFVPRKDSLNGKGACVYAVNDVNTITMPGQPPVGRLGAIMKAATNGSCAADEGSIEITKNMPLPAGVAGPFDFKFTASCTLAGVTTQYESNTLRLPSAVNKVSILHIPKDSVCEVTETLPAAPAGYTWDEPVISSLSAPIATGVVSAVTVDNALKADGGVSITTAITLPPGITGPFAVSYSMSCDRPSNPTAFGPVTTNAPATPGATVPSIPAGATCAVSETPPAAPAGYTWSAGNPPVNVTVPSGANAPANFSLRLTAITTPGGGGSGGIAAVPGLEIPGLLALSGLLVAVGAVVQRRQKRAAAVR